MIKALRNLTDAAWDYLNGSGPDAGPRIEQAAIFASDALAYAHHEDCDYRNAHIAGTEHDCNLDCEATAMEVPHLTREELFQCIIGLEALRDNLAELAREDRSHWRDPAFGEDQAAKWRAESVQAENLRERLKATPNYRP